MTSWECFENKVCTCMYTNHLAI